MCFGYNDYSADGAVKLDKVHMVLVFRYKMQCVFVFFAENRFDDRVIRYVCATGSHRQTRLSASFYSPSFIPYRLYFHHICRGVALRYFNHDRADMLPSSRYYSCIRFSFHYSPFRASQGIRLKRQFPHYYL